MKHTLKNPNFMLLMATQTVEQIGDSLTLMSLIAWVMSMPGGTTTANMTILLFWIGLPIILIGPFSGVFIDRFSRKALLLSATFVKGSFIFLIFLYIKEPGLVPLLYFFVFMKSFATQFFIPAKSSFVPDIVKDRESLMEANSISTTAMVITQITTYAAAGLLIAEFGPQKILLASFLLYPLAMAMIAMIRAKEEHKAKSRIESFGHIAEDLVSGFKFMFGAEKIMFITRRVFFMMIAIMVFYIALTGGGLERMLLSAGHGIKPIGALGLMQAALGLGLVAGVLMIGRVSRAISDEKLIRAIFPVFGSLIIALYFVNNYFFLLAIALAGGMGGMMVLSIAETAVQKETPAGMRGRIFAAYYVFRNTGPLIASGLAGFLIRFIKEEEVMLAAGAALLLYGLVNMIWKKS